MTPAKWNRKLHRWAALLTFTPVGIIFFSGIFLQLKKHWSWVQPATRQGTDQELTLTWDEILAATRGIPEAGVAGWEDIERLDVRPARGMLKVRCKNQWEVQLDAGTGEILSSTYRRSDLIESIHDGSWFHEKAKVLVWLPTAFILCVMWGTGIYLWLLPHRIRRRRKVNDAT